MSTQLDITIDTTHEVLRERLRRAASVRHTSAGVRDRVRETDVFLASTARHLAAASAVLLPQVRRVLPDGDERAREVVRQCRLLEVALNQVKARLYGEAYAVHRTWPTVWDDVAEQFEQTLSLERALVERLAAELDDSVLDELAERVYHAELHAPTRPHPYLPHRGMPGAVARSVAARVDEFWDTAEGRMVPEPVRPSHRSNSLLEQYLLADPHVEDDPAP